MYRTQVITLITLIVLIISTACALPVVPVAVSGPTQDQTAALQTDVAQAVAETYQAGTAVANQAAQTLAALATNTPQFTLTPSKTSTPTLTLTPTFTFTPTIPKVTVSTNTYCRTGPGEPYDIVGVMNVGETAEVIGKNAIEDTWIIHLPSNPAKTCWLWGYYAKVSGDTSKLPVVTPPPTPTPAPSFNFSYKKYGVGPGYQCYMFEVTNIGGLTWESYSLNARDITQSISGSASGDAFISYDGWCAPLQTLLDLEKDETGIASVKMSIPLNPAGDQFEVTLRLCSKNGLTGVCVNKTISFIF